MNPEVQQAIDNINQYIVENHNNEITANILNPILIELANLFDLVGDLSELDTTEKDSVVSAINWLMTQINSGAEIHVGTDDPNITPPDNYAVGDLYSRLNVLGDPYKIYMYNGVEWAEIQRAINDLIISNDSTWSSEKISQAVQGDRFETIPTISLSDNDITITNSSWWIQGVNYNLIPDFEDTIPYTSEEGMTRKDIIVAVASNNFVRIQGIESDTNPFEPTIPPNTLLVTQIDVFHDSIGEPTEPIVGDNYVTKTSQGWVRYHLDISSPQVSPTLGTIHSIAFRAFANGHSIIGLNITTTNTPDKIWSGATFGIRNDSDFPITLKHLYISSSKIRFNFPSGQDLILTKEMGVKYFKIGTIRTTGPADAYCLNDFVSGGGGDFIPLSGTEVGKPVTGDVEMLPNTSLFAGEDSGIRTNYLRFSQSVRLKSTQLVGEQRIEIRSNDINLSSFLSDLENPERNISLRLISGDDDSSPLAQALLEMDASTKGLVGSDQFDKQNDRKAFAQIADVQNAAEEAQSNVAQEATNRQLAIETAGFLQRTGTAIAFDKWATYGTYDAPVSGNLSYSFASMVKGMIQVLYHQDINVPDVLQAGVMVWRSGDYVVENVNKITVHCIDENVIEVNIKAL